MGLVQKAEAVISGNASPGPLLAGFLRGLSLIYGLVVRLRSVLYDKGLPTVGRLPCRVLSVGNISVGGTGKTPVTLYLARMLRDTGYRPVILSRGYKGRAERDGGVVSDGETILMGPEEAGDEPFMMAAALKDVPVLVGRDRLANGRLAVARFQPDVVLLDDGFQHRRLFRDMDIVLIDAAGFCKNRHLLPRGPLREPVSALGRAHALILTRASGPATPARDLLARLAPGKPVFAADHQPYVAVLVRSGRGPAADPPKDAGFLKQARVFVFSGIAKNRAFRDMVAGLAGSVAGERAFADHHPYTPEDCAAVIRAAEHHDADFLVTTEKDYVKLQKIWESPIDLVVMGIDIGFQDRAAFAEAVRNRLQ